MSAEYLNEYGDYEDCLLLACDITNSMVLISLDGELGWCSAHLVEAD